MPSVEMLPATAATDAGLVAELTDLVNRRRVSPMTCLSRRAHRHIRDEFRLAAWS